MGLKSTATISKYVYLNITGLIESMHNITNGIQILNIAVFSEKLNRCPSPPK